jgi:hypothetical protein
MEEEEERKEPIIEDLVVDNVDVACCSSQWRYLRYWHRRALILMMNRLKLTIVKFTKVCL